MRLLSKINKECIKLALLSTAYGLPNIIRSKRLFNKIFWIIFLLTSSTAAIYYISSEINDYFEYQLVTLTKTDLDQPTQFPTVSFCSRKISFFDEKSLKQLLRVSTWFNYDTSIRNEPDNHFEAFHTSYGKCFRFNSGKNMRGSGILVKNATTGGYDDSLYMNILAPDGLIVLIHNKSSLPRIGFYNNHEDIIFASPGLRTNIGIRRIIENKLPEPYNQCLEDVSAFKKNKTIINYFLNINKEYSQMNCLELCFELNYIENRPCQCTANKLGSIFEDCFKEENYNLTGCTFEYKQNFYNNDLRNMRSSYCPAECNSIAFLSSVNTVKPPPNIEENITAINVYYSSLKHTSFLQAAKTTPQQLVSNIGGYLGLFVGMSFMSIFEISEILFEIAFTFANRKKIQTDQNNEVID